jgi:hypothetical protein
MALKAANGSEKGKDKCWGQITKIVVERIIEESGGNVANYLGVNKLIIMENNNNGIDEGEGMLRIDFKKEGK